jgi:hypothetical protein
MINLHVDYSGKSLDYTMASQMALTRARANNMRQPAIVSWRQHGSHGFSPSFEGADEESWWAKYGQGNGGQADISVGEDFEFIVMESGGFETVHSLPLRNLKDASGAEYVCLSPMLDDSNTPRKDACSPLDEWTADQY